MLPDSHRIPSLVQLCQRVAVANTEAIHDLGPLLPYKLAKPILERASVNVDHLLLLERSAPHLVGDSQEIWKDLCFRDYYLTAVKRYSPDVIPVEPDSWRARYFEIQDAEARRMDELGTKLRLQSQEADQRKRQREIKFTDRVPQPKRFKGGWATPVQPKTLFQKTCSEASKTQKTVYGSRIPPPMPTSKLSFLQARLGGVAMSSLSASSPSTSRVTVKTVIHKRPIIDPPRPPSSSPSKSVSSLPTSMVPSGSRMTSSTAASSSHLTSSSTTSSSTSFHRSPIGPGSASHTTPRQIGVIPGSSIAAHRPEIPPARTTSSSLKASRHETSNRSQAVSSDMTISKATDYTASLASSSPSKSDSIPSPDRPQLDRPIKPLPIKAKKDPMSCLFMPKNRVHSQRPCS